MISEFERRWVDTLQNYKWLQQMADNAHDFAQITPFSYLVSIPTIAIGATGSESTPIEDDSDFYLTSMTGEILIGDATNVTQLALVLVQVSDAATNRNLWREPVPLPLGFGGSSSFSQAFYNPAPRIFAASSRINVTAQAVSYAPDAGAVLSVRVNFNGAKVSFKRGNR